LEVFFFAVHHSTPTLICPWRTQTASRRSEKFARVQNFFAATKKALPERQGHMGAEVIRGMDRSQLGFNVRGNGWFRETC
jgi:hypothetical protein